MKIYFPTSQPKHMLWDRQTWKMDREQAGWQQKIER